LRVQRIHAGMPNTKDMIHVSYTCRVGYKNQLHYCSTMRMDTWSLSSSESFSRLARLIPAYFCLFNTLATRPSTAAAAGIESKWSYLSEHSILFPNSKQSCFRYGHLCIPHYSYVEPIDVISSGGKERSGFAKPSHTRFCLKSIATAELRDAISH
jgi:hypothetical protein